jgi:hypothetical protein
VSALPAAIVQAPRFDSYPELHVVREAEMAVLRVETCVCGGRIVQLEGDEIPRVVERHNATVQHMAWRAGS